MRDRIRVYDLRIAKRGTEIVKVEVIFFFSFQINSINAFIYLTHFVQPFSYYEKQKKIIYSVSQFLHQTFITSKNSIIHSEIKTSSFIQ